MCSFYDARARASLMGAPVLHACVCLIVCARRLVVLLTLHLCEPSGTTDTDRPTNKKTMTYAPGERTRARSSHVARRVWNGVAVKIGHATCVLRD